MLIAVLATAVLALPTLAAARDGSAVQAAIAARLERGPDALEADLARMGTPAIAPLFDVLAQDAVPAEWGSGEADVALSADARAAVLGALAAMPLGSLREHLALVAAEPDRGERRVGAALAVLDRAGTARDVALCARLAAPLEPGALVPRARRTEFERTLLAIAARDVGTGAALRGVFRELEPSLLAPAVRCIAAGSPAEAIELLASLLDRVAAIDGLLLVEIARVGALVPRPIAGQVLAAVRPSLGSNDVNEVLLAARALGGLDDFDAVPRLIVLLEANDERIREAADEALQRMTGRTFRSSARAWGTWYSAELEWWQGADRTLAQVKHADPAVALAALHQISGHRIHRHEIARAVATVLERPERELGLVACSILRSLASRAAVPALVRALAHGDADVAAAALKALRTLTGSSYAADDPAWGDLARREIPSTRG
jgi:hypothetical protein